MLLCHRVPDGDEVLIFHILDGERVVVVRFFCLLCRQCNAAAADHSVTQRIDGVSANRTDVEPAAQHIGGNVFVDNRFAAHQFDDGDAKGLGKGLQKADIRKSFGGFPLGNGLAADTDPVSQFCLGQAAALPQMFDGGSGHIAIHKYPVLS